MSSSRWKILGILILVVVAVASIESFSVWNKPVGESATSMPLTSSVQSTVSGTTLQTSSISTTSISYPPPQWITISRVRPVDYYLSLFDSNGTQPYQLLGDELRVLPGLSNATAVAQITYLALNATNPEVKEVFELMLKGGTADPTDFTYTVPNYNTELQVLYWLACQNQFKKDDTLALAVAMVDGFWVTIGDDQVRQAVQNDSAQLLRYFRETNELQEQNGYYLLEDYPLEAKIALAWTASITPSFSALPLVWGVTCQDERVHGYVMNGTRVTLEGYHWNTLSLATLRTMRDLMTKNGWIHKEPTETIPFLEQYFYFSDRHLWGHWTNEQVPVYITVDGRLVHDYTIGNVNWQLDFYLRTGNFQGQCTDESQWIDAWAKSWGIATTAIWRGGLDSNGNTPPGSLQCSAFSCNLL